MFDPKQFVRNLLLAIIIGWVICYLMHAFAVANLSAEASLQRSRDIQYWLDLSAKKPTDIRAKYMLGSSLMSNGQIVESEAVFKSIIREYPTSASGYNGLANLSERQGNLFEARRLWTVAASKYPHSSSSYANQRLKDTSRSTK